MDLDVCCTSSHIVRRLSSYLHVTRIRAAAAATPAASVAVGRAAVPVTPAIGRPPPSRRLTPLQSEHLFGGDSSLVAQVSGKHVLHQGGLVSAVVQQLLKHPDLGFLVEGDQLVGRVMDVAPSETIRNLYDHMNSSSMNFLRFNYTC